VQAQLFVTGKQYCDFIYYTGRELHMERIYLDDTMLKCMDRIYNFFLFGVLPELVAKCYTMKRHRKNQLKIIVDFD